MRHSKCPKCGPGASVTKFGRCVVCGSKIAGQKDDPAPALNANSAALVVAIIAAILAVVSVAIRGWDWAFGFAAVVSAVMFYVALNRKARATT